jgi:hypothetical protein
MVGFAHPFHTTGETFFDHLAETKDSTIFLKNALAEKENTTPIMHLI